MKIENSTRKDKRFMATYADGTKIHFGSKGASTYIDGKRTEKERQNYLKRHDVREDFNNPKSAGALSASLLWGSSKSLNKNHQDFMKKFKIN
jgi:hypothetical protein